jgi:small GTP-binding protein
MPNYATKVILVGASGVGKTTLIGSFLGNQFESTSKPTVAPAFCSRPVKLEGDTVVDLQCWDTAGQERYIAISQAYYRDADIALLCYAPADCKSIETWSQRVLDVTPTCKVFAVITKADLLTPDEIQADEAASAPVLKKLNAARFITSAKTGQGVNELIDSIAMAAIPEVVQPVSVTPTVNLRDERKNDAKCC